MVVRSPSGEQVKANLSAVDNYELLHFAALETGTYEIHISVAQNLKLGTERWAVCPSTGERSTFMAVAWDVSSSLEP
jgi:hypothetical protein